MSNQSELDPRYQYAIDSALAGDWTKAVELNLELLEEFPDDINILNRLAHAYAELGQVNKSSSTYKKVLEIDTYNPIAKRNLDKLSTLRGVELKPKEIKAIDPDIFLEEPGKTKAVTAVDLAMPKVLIQLRVADKVILKTNKSEVTILSEDNKRLGKLENTWGQEIAQAIALGSDFSAIVKAVNVGKVPKDSTLIIFIRELKRSKKLAHPTFPIDTNFTPYVKEETLSYIKEAEPNESEDNVEVVDEIKDDSEEPTDEVPAEAAEFVPTPDLVEDEEEFQELK